MPGRLIGIARKERPYAEPETLNQAHVSVEAGIDGDYRGRTSPNKVTVLAKEDWATACSALGRNLPWTTRRANLCVEGIELPKHVGARLKIGALLLEVIDETAPCSRMEKAGTGLRAALTPDWRGGVTCAVCEPAEIALGDAVELA